jgi:hypothetical protein
MSSIFNFPRSRPLRSSLNGIRYNVSGALLAFRAFGHLVAFLDALR